MPTVAVFAHPDDVPAYVGFVDVEEIREFTGVPPPGWRQAWSFDPADADPEDRRYWRVLIPNDDYERGLVLYRALWDDGAHDAALVEHVSLLSLKAQRRVFAARMRAQLEELPFATLPAPAVEAGLFNEGLTREQWQAVAFDDAGEVTVLSLAQTGCMRKCGIWSPDDPGNPLRIQLLGRQPVDPDSSFWFVAAVNELNLTAGVYWRYYVGDPPVTDEVPWPQLSA